MIWIGQGLKTFLSGTFYLYFLVISGCLSAPELYPPEKAPAYIRQLKYIRIYASSPKSDTGITLSKGELVSIMSTGKIRLYPGSMGDLPSSWNYTYFIDNRPYGNMNGALHGGTIEAPASGTLSLGFLDSDFFDNAGHFDVTIVVWNTKNPVQIAEFLGALKQSAPEHRGVREAHEQAEVRKQVAVAKEKTSKDIESVTAQLKGIKQETQKEPGLAGPGTNTKISLLETQLAELNAKLSQIEELSRQLETQRAESAHLSRKLEEINQREKELMSKIGNEAIGPPMLMVTSPADGIWVELDRVRLSGVAEDDRGLARMEVLVNGNTVESVTTGKAGGLGM
jgi:hypothetical protein